MNHVDDIIEVLRCFAFDACDTLFWRCDGEYAPVTFWAMCNDTFAWGCADAEPITEDDIALLKQTRADVGEHQECLADLYAARKRGVRPQGAVYPAIPEELWPLFNACGPRRDVGLLNPHPHGEGE